MPRGGFWVVTLQGIRRNHHETDFYFILFYIFFWFWWVWGDGVHQIRRIEWLLAN
jgi:hypothetical protein